MPNDISYALKLILPVHHARMSNVPLGYAFNPSLCVLKEFAFIGLSEREKAKF